MKKFFLGLAVVIMLMLAFAAGLSPSNTNWVQAAGGGFVAPAVPLEARDAEEIFQAGMTIRVKPVTVEIVKWPEGEITPGGKTLTITAVAKNHSSQVQEVIYYLDYLPETPTPLFSGTVAIDYDGKGPQPPEIGYTWGRKVPIQPGEEQILYISLSPAPWFPGPTQNGDLQLKLRVVRWLGPRG